MQVKSDNNLDLRHAQGTVEYYSSHFDVRKEQLTNFYDHWKARVMAGDQGSGMWRSYVNKSQMVGSFQKIYDLSCSFFSII